MPLRVHFIQWNVMYKPSRAQHYMKRHCHMSQYSLTCCVSWLRHAETWSAQICAFIDFRNEKRDSFLYFLCMYALIDANIMLHTFTIQSALLLWASALPAILVYNMHYRCYLCAVGNTIALQSATARHLEHSLACQPLTAVVFIIAQLHNIK